MASPETRPNKSPPPSRKRLESKEKKTKKTKSSRGGTISDNETVGERIISNSPTPPISSPRSPKSGTKSPSSASPSHGNIFGGNTTAVGQETINEGKNADRSSMPTTSLPISSASSTPGYQYTTPRQSVNLTNGGLASLTGSGNSSFANLPPTPVLINISSMGPSITYNDPSATSNNITASDFIIMTLLMEFRQHTKKKIDEILEFGVADKFLLEEVFESDPKLHQQFNSLTNMSQYHTSIIVDSLLKWRRNQLSEISQLLLHKDTRKMPTKDLTLIEERVRLAVEYIFARALIPILDSITFRKSTLDVSFCSEIEDIAFSFFKAPKKADDDIEDLTVLGNRKKIPTLYAKVIGILSETRFKFIFPRFLKATTDTPVRSKKAIYVIMGIRYVRFFIESPEGIELSSNFLNALLKLFKAAQPIEVKQALSELIVRLLRGSILSTSPICDYSSWYQLLNSIYTSNSLHPKKSKNNKESVVLIPMVTAILCSLKRNDFLVHYREWLSRLHMALKDFKTRTVALEGILFVMETFYLKVGNESPSALHALLEESGNIVLNYCTLKRPLLTDKGDSLDIFVDLVVVIAQISLSYAIEEVLFQLLAFNQSSFINSNSTITNSGSSSSTTPTSISNPPAVASLTSTSSSLFPSGFLPFSPFSSAPNPYAFAPEKIIVAVRAIAQLKSSDTLSFSEKLTKRLLTMSQKDLMVIVYNHMIQSAQIPVSIATTNQNDSASPSSLFMTPISSSASQSNIPVPTIVASSSSSQTGIPSSPPALPSYYTSNSSKEARSAILNSYWDTVTSMWAQVLLHLDSVIGHLLYSTSYKTLYDLIRPERDLIAIQLLQLLLHSIPTVVPKVPIPKLVSILSKYTIHLDKGIEEMATGALSRLMSQRPEFRPFIISGLADFVVTLSHNRQDLIFTMLFKLGQLFKQWIEILKPPFDLPKGAASPMSTPSELDNLPVTRLEGIALIFLCSPKSKIRLIALEILKSVRSVESLLGKLTFSRSSSFDLTASTDSSATQSTQTQHSQPPPGLLSSIIQSTFNNNSSPSSAAFGNQNTRNIPYLPQTRIMDIIDEAGPEIIRSIQSDSKYFSLQAIPITVKTIDRLAARDTKEDQWLWSHALGELLRHFCLLQPEPALVAAYLIQSRLREIKPDDKESTSNASLEQEELHFWWRNYITFECVTLVPHMFNTLHPSVVLNGGPFPTSSNFPSLGHMSSSGSGPLSSTVLPTSPDANKTSLNPEMTNPSFGTKLDGQNETPLTPSRHDSKSLPALKDSISQQSTSGSVSSSQLAPHLQSSSSQSSVGHQQILTPKEMFLMILPYLKSSNDMLRESSVMALQRTNFTSAEILSECLKSYEKEFQGDHSSDKKRKIKRDRLRLEVTSIYTSIVESIRQTELCRNPTLRSKIVSFVNELYQYLKTKRNLFDLLQLRYQYCVIVTRVAQELYAGSQASKEFQQSNDEVSLRKNAFSLLATWCSGDIFQDEGTKKHLNSLLSAIKDGEKRKAYVNALREHILVLQYSSFTAMSACLMGPHFEAILPDNSFFEFVDGFLRHSLDKVRLLARFMLESFLGGNLSQPHVLELTLDKCYHVDAEIASQYFLCLVELFPEETHFACSEVVLLHLIIYMVGNADFHVRRAAKELLLMLKSLSNEDESWLTTIPFVVDSALVENYERAQIDLSYRLAESHPQAAPEIIAEMVSRLEQVSPNSKRQLLRSTVAWIEKLEFDRQPPNILDALMENLLFVTLRYKQDFPREVELLWTTVARTNSNLKVVIRELLAIGMERQNTDIIPLAKLICIYLARTASKVVVDTLVQELGSVEPAFMPKSARSDSRASESRLGALQRLHHHHYGSLQTKAPPISSLGGSQSNSNASLPSLNNETEPEGSTMATKSGDRTRASSISSEVHEKERPRSSTYDGIFPSALDGSYLVPEPATGPAYRRSSFGGGDKDNIAYISAFNTTNASNTANSNSFNQNSFNPNSLNLSSFNQKKDRKSNTSVSPDRPRASSSNQPATAKTASDFRQSQRQAHFETTNEASSVAPSSNNNNQNVNSFNSKLIPPTVVPHHYQYHPRLRRHSMKSSKRSNQRAALPRMGSHLGTASDSDSSDASSTSFFGLHPLYKLIPILNTPWGLTRGHFILTILAQLTYESSEQFRDHLPIIFQLAFLGIDFPNPLVYEHCRIILLNVIHSLIVLPLEQIDMKTWALQERYSEALHLAEYLRSSQGEPLWAHEDVTMKKPEIKSASQLTSLVQAIVKAFNQSGVKSDLAETWAAQALGWAVHGQSWHITGRSFQIYRALRPAITRDAQNDLLECLLRSIVTRKQKKGNRASDSHASRSLTSRENLSLTIEVLITLQTLARAQSAQKLILFPQMFWTSVALLHTDYEQHYLASLKLLADLLDRLNFHDRYVQNIFSASIPKEWDPPFRGIQPLVTRGLYSSATDMKAIEVLSKLILIPYDQVLHPEPGRIFHTIISLLPFICTNIRNTESRHATSIQSTSSSTPTGTSLKRQSSEIAEKLSIACSQLRLMELSKIFAKFSRFEYETTEEFIMDFKKPFGNALAALHQSMTAQDKTNNTQASSTVSSTISNTNTASTTTIAAITTTTMPTNAAQSQTSTAASTTTPQSSFNTTDKKEDSHHTDFESSSSSSSFGGRKSYFKLESALSILFSMLDHSTSHWRRATLLIIFGLLQHRYPPHTSSQSIYLNENEQKNQNLKENVSNSNNASNNNPITSSNSHNPLNLPPHQFEMLEKILQPAWLVTLLKQMSSSSWQQALLILDLSLQHSSITIAEIDPFLLKETSKAASSTASGKTGKSYFSDRSESGVQSASLALDKILSTEHRKRNMTLDSSVLSMFDGWYDDESRTQNLKNRKNSIEAENSDYDESISTEDQISYLLQTSNKVSTAIDKDPFDAISTSVPASTLGRFPTFRGFEELLTKLESLPSTPMTTLDSKPSQLDEDALRLLEGEFDVLQAKKGGKKKSLRPKKSIQDIPSSTASKSDQQTNLVKKLSKSSHGSVDSNNIRSFGSMRIHEYEEDSINEDSESGAVFSSSLSSSSSYEMLFESNKRSNKLKQSSDSKLDKPSRTLPATTTTTTSDYSQPYGNSSTSGSIIRHSQNDLSNDSDESPRTPSKERPKSLKLEKSRKSNSKQSTTTSHPSLPSSPRNAPVRPSSKSQKSNTSSKYPSGLSDDAPNSGRIKRLEFSFSPEFLTRTKRWRAILLQEAKSSSQSSHVSPLSSPKSASLLQSSAIDTTGPEDLSSLFKIFSSAIKLMVAIRSDFRSCLTLYCRLVVPPRSQQPDSSQTESPRRSKKSSSSKTTMRAKKIHSSEPHKALLMLLERVQSSEMESLVPNIPDMMLDILPSKYKKLVKRDISFASSFKDQRTKLIEEVNQNQLAYTEQRISTENIKSKLSSIDLIEENMRSDEEATDTFETRERLSLEFAVAVCDLHQVALNSLLIQSSLSTILGPLLESSTVSGTEEVAKNSQHNIENEILANRAIVSALQSKMSATK